MHVKCLRQTVQSMKGGKIRRRVLVHRRAGAQHDWGSDKDAKVATLSPPWGRDRRVRERDTLPD